MRRSVRRRARREMELRMAGDPAPEPLLGKRIGLRRCAQAGLDVHHGVTCLGAGTRPGVCGQRVALHQHERRLAAVDDFLEATHEVPARDAEVGRGREGRELDVARDPELGESPPHGLGMLAAVGDDAAEGAALGELAHDGRELDALGTGPGDDEYVVARRASLRVGDARARQRLRRQRGRCFEHESPQKVCVRRLKPVFLHVA